MVTVGLARTRRTITAAVRSRTSAFHKSAAPAPAEVPVSAAPNAATEPAVVTTPMTRGHRPGSSEFRSASSSTRANKATWISAATCVPLNAENRYVPTRTTSSRPYRPPRCDAPVRPRPPRPAKPRGSGVGLAVEGVLQFLLALLGQRGLDHRAAVLAHRLDGLVRGDLLHHQEQARCSRLQHAADLVLERLVDAGLGDLAHERAHPGADRHPEDRDEEQQAEQHAPEHAPGRPAADHVVTGVRVVLAFPVPHDHRDGVGLDDQVLGQPPRLGGSLVGGGLVGVTDRDQVSHGFLSSLLCWGYWVCDQSSNRVAIAL